MSRLELSPLAKEDLIEIGVWIARRSGSRETARRFVQKVLGVCERLALNPEMGQLRTEFSSGHYRSFSIGNYVIYYRPAAKGVCVARVLHGSRDHGALL